MKNGIVLTIILSLIGIAGCDDRPGSVGPDMEPSIHLNGSFTIEEAHDVDYDPSTDHFGYLLGREIRFEFEFKEYTERTGMDGTGLFKQRRIYIQEMNARFRGDPTLSMDLYGSARFSNSRRKELTLVAESSRIYVWADFYTERGEVSYGFFFWGFYSGSLNDEGYPVFEEIPLTESKFMLQRYTEDGEFQMTDFAEGSVEFYLSGSGGTVE